MTVIQYALQIVALSDAETPFPTTFRTPKRTAVSILFSAKQNSNAEAAESNRQTATPPSSLKDVNDATIEGTTATIPTTADETSKIRFVLQ